MRIRIKYMAIGAAGGAFFGSFIGIIPAALGTGIARGSYIEDFLNKRIGKGEFVNCTRNEDVSDPGVGYVYKSDSFTKNNYTDSEGDDDLGNDYPIICTPRNSTKEQLLWNGANDYADSFPDSSIFYWMPSCIGICAGISILVGAGGGYYLTDDRERVVVPVLDEDDALGAGDQELHQPVIEVVVPEAPNHELNPVKREEKDEEPQKKLTFQEQYADAGCTDEIPDHFKDPVDGFLMDDPRVITGGHSIDARTLHNPLFQQKNPLMVGVSITESLKNINLKQAIESWVKEKVALRQQAIINQKLQSDPILPPSPAAPPEEEKRIVVPFLNSRVKFQNRINQRYLCHATGEVMRDPVTSNGNNYERSALEGKGIDFTPNEKLKKEIEAWLKFEETLAKNKDAQAASSSTPEASLREPLLRATNT